MIGGAPGADPGTEVRAAARMELVKRAEAGTLSVLVAATYPLTEAADALRQLATGHTHGKIVLVPPGGPVPAPRRQRMSGMSGPQTNWASCGSGSATTSSAATRPSMSGSPRPWPGTAAVLDLVRAAPPEAHLPPTLLGAVHYLLLDGLDHPLADVYAGRSGRRPRSRCSSTSATPTGTGSPSCWPSGGCRPTTAAGARVIGPGLTWIAEQIGGPFALVDVGASAGLNLLCDRYRLDYGDHGATGPADSPVVVACGCVAGAPAHRRPAADPAQPAGHRPLARSTSATPTTPAGCWPACGPTPAASSARRPRSAWPRPTCRRCWRAMPSTTLPGARPTWTTGRRPWWSPAGPSPTSPLDQRRRFTDLLAGPPSGVRWPGCRPTAPARSMGVAEPSLTDHDGAQAHVLGAVLFEAGAAHPHLLAVVQQHGGWIDWRAPAG